MVSSTIRLSLSSTASADKINLGGGWTEVSDEVTRCSYFYNSVSGEVSWSRPKIDERLVSTSPLRMMKEGGIVIESDQVCVSPLGGANEEEEEEEEEEDDVNKENIAEGGGGGGEW